MKRKLPAWCQVPDGVIGGDGSDLVAMVPALYLLNQPMTERARL